MNEDELYAIAQKHFADQNMTLSKEEYDDANNPDSLDATIADGEKNRKSFVPYTDVVINGYGRGNYAGTNTGVYFMNDVKKDYALHVKNSTLRGKQPEPFESFEVSHDVAKQYFTEDENKPLVDVFSWMRLPYQAIPLVDDMREEGSLPKGIDQLGYIKKQRSTPNVRSWESGIGNKGTESFLTSDQMKETLGYYKEDGGRGKAQGLEKYQYLSAQGFPTRTDEATGQQYMLVDGFDRETGDAIWVERKADDMIDGGKLRSLAGPQDRHQGYVSAFLEQGINTMGDMFIGTAYSIDEIVSSMISGDDGQRAKNARANMNMRNARKGKLGKNQEDDDGWFSAKFLGGVVGNILPMAIGIGAAGAIARNATAMGVGAANAARAGNLTSKALNWGYLGGAYAGHVMNEQAMAVGMPLEERRKLYGLMLGMTLATEWGMGKLLGTKGYFDEFRAPGELMESMAKHSAETLKAMGGANAKAEAVAKAFIPRLLSDTPEVFAAANAAAAAGAGKRSIGRKVMDAPMALFGRVNKWADAKGLGNNISDLGYGVRAAIAGGKEEAFEEVVQSAFENAFKTYHDWYHYGDPTASGKRRGDTKEGLFGAYDTERGAVGSWAENTMSEMAMNAWGGFLGGSMMGAFRKNPTKTLQNDMYFDAIYQLGGAEEAKAFLHKVIDKEEVGSTAIDVNGKSIPQGDKAAVSQRQGYKDAVSIELDRMAFHMGASAFGVDMKAKDAPAQLAKRVKELGGRNAASKMITAMEFIKDKNIQLAADEAVMQDATASEADKTVAAKRIEDTKKDIAALEKVTQKIASGEYAAGEQWVNETNKVALAKANFDFDKAKAVDESSPFNVPLIADDKFDPWAQIPRIQEINEETRKWKDGMDERQQKAEEHTRAIEDAAGTGDHALFTQLMAVVPKSFGDMSFTGDNKVRINNAIKKMQKAALSYIKSALSGKETIASFNMPQEHVDLFAKHKDNEYVGNKEKIDAIAEIAAEAGVELPGGDYKETLEDATKGILASSLDDVQKQELLAKIQKVNDSLEVETIRGKYEGEQEALYTKPVYDELPEVYQLEDAQGNRLFVTDHGDEVGKTGYGRKLKGGKFTLIAKATPEQKALFHALTFTEPGGENTTAQSNKAFMREMYNMQAVGQGQLDAVEQQMSKLREKVRVFTVMALSDNVGAAPSFGGKYSSDGLRTYLGLKPDDFYLGMKADESQAMANGMNAELAQLARLHEHLLSRSEKMWEYSKKNWEEKKKTDARAIKMMSNIIGSTDPDFDLLVPNNDSVQTGVVGGTIKDITDEAYAKAMKKMSELLHDDKQWQKILEDLRKGNESLFMANPNAFPNYNNNHVPLSGNEARAAQLVRDPNTNRVNGFAFEYDAAINLAQLLHDVDVDDLFASYRMSQPSANDTGKAAAWQEQMVVATELAGHLIASIDGKNAVEAIDAAISGTQDKNELGSTTSGRGNAAKAFYGIETKKKAAEENAKAVADTIQAMTGRGVSNAFAGMMTVIGSAGSGKSKFIIKAALETAIRYYASKGQVAKINEMMQKVVLVGNVAPILANLQETFKAAVDGANRGVTDASKLAQMPVFEEGKNVFGYNEFSDLVMSIQTEGSPISRDGKKLDAKAMKQRFEQLPFNGATIIFDEYAVMRESRFPMDYYDSPAAWQENGNKMASILTRLEYVGASVLMTGDNMQMADDKSTSANQGLPIKHAYDLITNLRSGDMQIRGFDSLCRAYIGDVRNLTKAVNEGQSVLNGTYSPSWAPFEYFMDKDTRSGVQARATREISDSDVQRVKNAPTALDGTPTMVIIVARDADREKYIAAGVADDKVKTLDVASKNSAQGMEFDEVYVDVSPADYITLDKMARAQAFGLKNTPQMSDAQGVALAMEQLYYKALLTAVSRARNFASVHGSFIKSDAAQTKEEYDRRNKVSIGERLKDAPRVEMAALLDRMVGAMGGSVAQVPQAQGDTAAPQAPAPVTPPSRSFTAKTATTKNSLVKGTTFVWESEDIVDANGAPIAMGTEFIVGDTRVNENGDTLVALAATGGTSGVGDREVLMYVLDEQNKKGKCRFVSSLAKKTNLSEKGYVQLDGAPLFDSSVIADVRITLGLTQSEAITKIMEARALMLSMMLNGNGTTLKAMLKKRPSNLVRFANDENNRKEWYSFDQKDLPDHSVNLILPPNVRTAICKLLQITDAAQQEKLVQAVSAFQVSVLSGTSGLSSNQRVNVAKLPPVASDEEYDVMVEFKGSKAWEPGVGKTYGSNELGDMLEWAQANGMVFDGFYQVNDGAGQTKTMAVIGYTTMGFSDDQTWDMQTLSTNVENAGGMIFEVQAPELSPDNTKLAAKWLTKKENIATPDDIMNFVTYNANHLMAKFPQAMATYFGSIENAKAFFTMAKSYDKANNKKAIVKQAKDLLNQIAADDKNAVTMRISTVKTGANKVEQNEAVVNLLERLGIDDTEMRIAVAGAANPKGNGKIALGYPSFMMEPIKFGQPIPVVSNGTADVPIPQGESAEDEAMREFDSDLYDEEARSLIDSTQAEVEAMMANALGDTMAQAGVKASGKWRTEQAGKVALGMMDSRSGVMTYLSDGTNASMQIAFHEMTHFAFDFLLHTDEINALRAHWLEKLLEAGGTLDVAGRTFTHDGVRDSDSELKEIIARGGEAYIAEKKGKKTSWLGGVLSKIYSFFDRMFDVFRGWNASRFYDDLYDGSYKSRTPYMELQAQRMAEPDFRMSDSERARKNTIEKVFTLGEEFRSVVDKTTRAFINGGYNSNNWTLPQPGKLAFERRKNSSYRDEAWGVYRGISQRAINALKEGGMLTENAPMDGLSEAAMDDLTKGKSPVIKYDINGNVKTVYGEKRTMSKQDFRRQFFDGLAGSIKKADGTFLDAKDFEAQRSKVAASYNVLGSDGQWRNYTLGELLAFDKRGGNILSSMIGNTSVVGGTGKIKDVLMVKLYQEEGARERFMAGQGNMEMFEMYNMLNGKTFNVILQESFPSINFYKLMKEAPLGDMEARDRTDSNIDNHQQDGTDKMPPLLHAVIASTINKNIVSFTDGTITEHGSIFEGDYAFSDLSVLRDMIEKHFGYAATGKDTVTSLRAFAQGLPAGDTIASWALAKGLSNMMQSMMTGDALTGAMDVATLRNAMNGFIAELNERSALKTDASVQFANAVAVNDMLAENILMRTFLEVKTSRKAGDIRMVSVDEVRDTLKRKINGSINDFNISDYDLRHMVAVYDRFFSGDSHSYMVNAEGKYTEADLVGWMSATSPYGNARPQTRQQFDEVKAQKQELAREILNGLVGMFGNIDQQSMSYLTMNGDMSKMVTSRGNTWTEMADETAQQIMWALEGTGTEPSERAEATYGRGLYTGHGIERAEGTRAWATKANDSNTIYIGTSNNPESEKVPFITLTDAGPVLHEFAGGKNPFFTGDKVSTLRNGIRAAFNEMGIRVSRDTINQLLAYDQGTNISGDNMLGMANVFGRLFLSARNVGMGAVSVAYGESAYVDNFAKANGKDKKEAAELKAGINKEIAKVNDMLSKWEGGGQMDYGKVVTESGASFFHPSMFWRQIAVISQLEMTSGGRAYKKQLINAMGTKQPANPLNSYSGSKFPDGDSSIQQSGPVPDYMEHIMGGIQDPNYIALGDGQSFGINPFQMFGDTVMGRTGRGVGMMTTKRYSFGALKVKNGSFETAKDTDKISAEDFATVNMTAFDTSLQQGTNKMKLSDSARADRTAELFDVTFDTGGRKLGSGEKDFGLFTIAKGDGEMDINADYSAMYAGVRAMAMQYYNSQDQSLRRISQALANSGSAIAPYNDVAGDAAMLHHVSGDALTQEANNLLRQSIDYRMAYAQAVREEFKRLTESGDAALFLERNRGIRSGLDFLVANKSGVLTLEIGRTAELFYTPNMRGKYPETSFDTINGKGTRYKAAVDTDFMRRMLLMEATGLQSGSMDHEGILFGTGNKAESGGNQFEMQGLYSWLLDRYVGQLKKGGYVISKSFDADGTANENMYRTDKGGKERVHPIIQSQYMSEMLFHSARRFMLDGPTGAFKQMSWDAKYAKQDTTSGHRFQLYQPGNVLTEEFVEVDGLRLLVDDPRLDTITPYGSGLEEYADEGSLESTDGITIVTGMFQYGLHKSLGGDFGVMPATGQMKFSFVDGPAQTKNSTMPITPDMADNPVYEVQQKRMLDPTNIYVEGSESALEGMSDVDAALAATNYYQLKKYFEAAGNGNLETNRLLWEAHCRLRKAGRALPYIQQIDYRSTQKRTAEFPLTQESVMNGSALQEGGNWLSLATPVANEKELNVTSNVREVTLESKGQALQQLFNYLSATATAQERSKRIREARAQITSDEEQELVDRIEAALELPQQQRDRALKAIDVELLKEARYDGAGSVGSELSLASNAAAAYMPNEATVVTNKLQSLLRHAVKPDFQKVSTNEITLDNHLFVSLPKYPKMGIADAKEMAMQLERSGNVAEANEVRAEIDRLWDISVNGGTLDSGNKAATMHLSDKQGNKIGATDLEAAGAVLAGEDVNAKRKLVNTLLKRMGGKYDSLIGGEMDFNDKVAIIAQQLETITNMDKGVMAEVSGNWHVASMRRKMAQQQFNKLYAEKNLMVNPEDKVMPNIAGATLGVRKGMKFINVFGVFGPEGNGHSGYISMLGKADKQALFNDVYFMRHQIKMEGNRFNTGQYFTQGTYLGQVLESWENGYDLMATPDKAMIVPQKAAAFLRKVVDFLPTEQQEHAMTLLASFDELEKSLATEESGVQPSDYTVILDDLVRMAALMQYATNISILENSLDVIGVRTPTEDSRSAHWAKVIAFDDYAENTSFSSSARSVLDGRDFDYDRLDTLTKASTFTTMGVDGESEHYMPMEVFGHAPGFEDNNELQKAYAAEAQKNFLLDDIFGYYQATEEGDEALGKIYAPISARVNKIVKASEAFSKKQNAAFRQHDPYSTNRMKASSNLGKDNVGIAATFSKALSAYLVATQGDEEGPTMPDNIFGKVTDKMRTRIVSNSGVFITMFLDDEKLGAMSNYNVNRNVAPSVMMLTAMSERLIPIANQLVAGETNRDGSQKTIKTQEDLMIWMFESDAFADILKLLEKKYGLTSNNFSPPERYMIELYNRAINKYSKQNVDFQMDRATSQINEAMTEMLAALKGQLSEKSFSAVAEIIASEETVYGKNKEFKSVFSRILSDTKNAYRGAAYNVNSALESDDSDMEAADSEIEENDSTIDGISENQLSDSILDASSDEELENTRSTAIDKLKELQDSLKASKGDVGPIKEEIKAVEKALYNLERMDALMDLYASQDAAYKKVRMAMSKLIRASIKKNRLVEQIQSGKYVGQLRMMAEAATLSQAFWPVTALARLDQFDNAINTGQLLSVKMDFEKHFGLPFATIKELANGPREAYTKYLTKGTPEYKARKQFIADGELIARRKKSEAWKRTMVPVGENGQLMNLINDRLDIADPLFVMRDNAELAAYMAKLVTHVDSRSGYPNTGIAVETAIKELMSPDYFGHDRLGQTRMALVTESVDKYIMTRFAQEVLADDPRTRALRFEARTGKETVSVLADLSSPQGRYVTLRMLSNKIEENVNRLLDSPNGQGNMFLRDLEFEKGGNMEFVSMRRDMSKASDESKSLMRRAYGDLDKLPGGVELKYMFELMQVLRGTLMDKKGNFVEFLGMDIRSKYNRFIESKILPVFNSDDEAVRRVATDAIKQHLIRFASTPEGMALLNGPMANTDLGGQQIARFRRGRQAYGSGKLTQRVEVMEDLKDSTYVPYKKRFRLDAPNMIQPVADANHLGSGQDGDGSFFDEDGNRYLFDHYDETNRQIVAQPLALDEPMPNVPDGAKLRTLPFGDGQKYWQDGSYGLGVNSHTSEVVVGKGSKAKRMIISQAFKEFLDSKPDATAAQKVAYYDSLWSSWFGQDPTRLNMLKLMARRQNEGFVIYTDETRYGGELGYSVRSAWMRIAKDMGLVGGEAVGYGDIMASRPYKGLQEITNLLEDEVLVFPGLEVMSREKKLLEETGRAEQILSQHGWKLTGADYQEIKAGKGKSAVYRVPVLNAKNKISAKETSKELDKFIKMATAEENAAKVFFIAGERGLEDFVAALLSKFPDGLPKNIRVPAKMMPTVARGKAYRATMPNIGLSLSVDPNGSAGIFDNKDVVALDMTSPTPTYIQATLPLSAFMDTLAMDGEMTYQQTKDGEMVIVYQQKENGAKDSIEIVQNSRFLAPVGAKVFTPTGRVFTNKGQESNGKIVLDYDADATVRRGTLPVASPALISMRKVLLGKSGDTGRKSLEAMTQPLVDAGLIQTYWFDQSTIGDVAAMGKRLDGPTFLAEYNGKLTLFINSDKVDDKMLLHELGHIEYLLMDLDKGEQADARRARRDAVVDHFLGKDGDSAFARKIREVYGAIGNMELRTEAFAYIMQYGRDNLTLENNQDSLFVQRMFPDIKDVFTQMFERSDVQGDTLSPAFAAKMTVKDWVNGLQKQLQGGERSILLDTARLGRIAADNAIEVADLSVLLAKGLEGKTLYFVAPPTGTIDNMAQVKRMYMGAFSELPTMSELTAAASSALIGFDRHVSSGLYTTEDFTTIYNGEKYTVPRSKYLVGEKVDYTKLNDYVLKNIAPAILGDMNKRAEQLTGFMKEVAALDKGLNRDDFFVAVKSIVERTLHKELAMEREKMKEGDFEGGIEKKAMESAEGYLALLKDLDYNPHFDVAITGPAGVEELAKYGVTLSSSLWASGMVAIVHNAIGNDAGRKSVSVFTVSGMALYARETEGLDNRNIAAAFHIDNRTAKKAGIKMTNQFADTGKMNAFFIASAIDKANEGVYIKRVGTVSLKSRPSMHSKLGYELAMENSLDALQSQAGILFGLPEVKGKLSGAAFAHVNGGLSVRKLDLMDRIMDTMQSNMFRWKTYYSDKPSIEEKFGKPKSIENREAALEEVEKMVLGNLVTGQDYSQAVKALDDVIAYIYRYYSNEGKTLDMAPSDRELTQLIAMRMAMLSFAGKEINTNGKDIDALWSVISRPNMLDNDLLQFVTMQMDHALRLSNQQLAENVAKNNDRLKEYIKAYAMANDYGYTEKSHLQDISGKLFEPLYKKRELKVLTEDGREGETVTRNLHEIYWDVTDAETIAEMNRPGSGLTREMVEYGKFLVDGIEQLFLRSMRDDNPTLDPADIEARLASMWRKGQMPVMPQSFTAYIAKLSNLGNMKETIDAMGNQVMNMESMFGGEGGTNDELFSQYGIRKAVNRMLAQFTEQGKRTRAQEIGITEEVSKYNDAGTPETITMYALPGDAHERVNKNLQLTYNYIASTAIRKGHMNKIVLPAVQQADTIMRMMEKQSGIKQDRLRRNMEAATNRVVFGRMMKVGEVGGWDVDTVMSAATYAFTAGIIGLSPIVGAKSFINGMERMLSMAVRDSAGRTGGVFFEHEGDFGVPAFTKAVSMLSEKGNIKKMHMLARLFQVSHMTEQDLLRGAQNNLTQNNLLNGQFMNIFNIYGDQALRMTAMAAQMIHDGSWDAYSVEGTGNDYRLVYDEKKDGLFYDKDGNARPGSEQMKQMIKRNLAIEQYSFNGETQKEQGHLIMGHDSARQRKYVQLGDRITSLTLAQHLKPYMGQYTVVNAAMSLRSYMVDKVTHMFMGKRELQYSGTYTYDKNGGAGFAKEEIEGLMTTLVTLAQGIGKGKLSPNTWTVAEKKNMAGLGMDLAVIGLLTALAMAMAGGGDDDEAKEDIKRARELAKKHGTEIYIAQGYADKDGRFHHVKQGPTTAFLHRIISGSATELLVDASPAKVLENLTGSFVAIEFLTNIWNTFASVVNIPSIYNDGVGEYVGNVGSNVAKFLPGQALIKAPLPFVDYYIMGNQYNEPKGRTPKEFQDNPSND